MSAFGKVHAAAARALSERWVAAESLGKGTYLTTTHHCQCSAQGSDLLSQLVPGDDVHVEGPDQSFYAPSRARGHSWRKELWSTATSKEGGEHQNFDVHLIFSAANLSVTFSLLPFLQNSILSYACFA